MRKYRRMRKYKGIGVSEGIAIGRIYLYQNEPISIPLEEKDNLSFEIKKKIIEEAFDRLEKELSVIYEKLKDEVKEEAEIITAQILMLDDPDLKEEIYKFLKEGFSPPSSIKKAFKSYIDTMKKLNNAYLKERIRDIEDVEEGLLRILTKKPKKDLSHLPFHAIIFARDLTPSDTAGIDRDHVLGIVTEEGGKTSHTAILSEALGIPAVLGVSKITEEIKEGDIAIVDGKEGVVIINPEKDILEDYQKRVKTLNEYKEKLKILAQKKVKTKKGKEIEVSANIGSLQDIEIALSMGADGVGLFRTEFLFLNRKNPPKEEEQFETYKEVLKKFKDKPVIIRTLDIGGDKQLSYINLKEEQNPFLGIRGIRLTLRERELFKTQLRAILRASIYGNVKIMYPMIAIEKEIVEANEILEDAKRELKEKGIEFDEGIEVGIMIEIPAAALNAEELIKYVNFFSIGTNDLIQYTFAADRTNNELDYLYLPTHPSLLKLIKLTVEASHKAGKWTGVCGEIAGDPEAIPYLINIGVDELSMSPSKIPKIKELIPKI